MKKKTKNHMRERCHPPDPVVGIRENPEPHFFSIIVSPTVQLRQLKIPDKFVEKHGDQLPERVRLQIRNDTEKWPVGLVKQNGKIWLLKGWSNFAEHYHLCIGQLLMFRYSCKNSGFHVSVFDVSATDVEYRSSVSGRALGFHRGDPPVTEIREDDGDDDGDGDSLGEDSEDEEDYSSSEVVDASGTGRCSKKSRVAEIPPSLHYDEEPSVIAGGDGRRTIMQYASNQRNAANNRAIMRRAKTLIKSEKPHFLKYMTPYYIYTAYSIYLPMSHSQAYLNGDEEGYSISFHTTLEDGEILKTWRLPYVYDYPATCSASSEQVRVRLVSGWKDFVKDNELRVGDVCLFELIDLVAKSYRVTVVRFDDQDNTQRRSSLLDLRRVPAQRDPPPSAAEPIMEKERGPKRWKSITKPGRRYVKKMYKGRDVTTLMQRANCFKSKNPHFAVYISATSVNGRSGLRLPLQHSSRYFKNVEGIKNNVVTLTSGNTLQSKRQTVRYRFEKDTKRRNVWFCGAEWNRFARDNSIKMGDACVLELVNVEPMVYQVTVFRHT